MEDGDADFHELQRTAHKSYCAPNAGFRRLRRVRKQVNVDLHADRNTLATSRVCELLTHPFPVNTGMSEMAENDKLSVFETENMLTLLSFLQRRRWRVVQRRRSYSDRTTSAATYDSKLEDRNPKLQNWVSAANTIWLIGKNHPNGDTEIRTR